MLNVNCKSISFQEHVQSIRIPKQFSCTVITYSVLKSNLVCNSNITPCSAVCVYPFKVTDEILMNGSK
jgi:hypothetical protein